MAALPPSAIAFAAPDAFRDFLVCVARWEAVHGRTDDLNRLRDAAWAWVLARVAASDPDETEPLARLLTRPLPGSSDGTEWFRRLQGFGLSPQPMGEADRSERAWNLGIAHDVLRSVQVGRAPDAGWVVILQSTDRVAVPRPLFEQEWTDCTNDERARLLATRTGRSLRSVRAALRQSDDGAEPFGPELGMRLAPGSLFLRPCETNRELGAHYTPRSVVLEVAEATLRPLIRAKGASAAAGLTVCDPSVGTGAFVWASAQVLAESLAGCKTGAVHDAALARVAGNLYGVDLDPYAVGVTRAVLWVLTGRRASVDVEAQVRVGDALVGLTWKQWVAEARPPCVDRCPPRVQVDWADATWMVRALGGSARRREARRLSLVNGPLVSAEWRAPDWVASEWPRHPSGEPVRPFHWGLAFPRIFGTERAGFDAVVGNPPYRSARSVDSSMRRAYRDLLRGLHPDFTRGAFDLSTVFWSRVVGDLLGDEGRYGMVVPTASLSSEDGWQQRVDAIARPDCFVLYPVDCFPDARVRTVGVIGGRMPTAGVHVVDHDAHPARRGWVVCEPMPFPWYARTRLDDPGMKPRAPVVTLGSLVEVRAGCATDAAYRLAEVVVDHSSAAELKLITTGAIDRYRCRWGERPIRFLGSRHERPAWPEPCTIRSVQRAASAQRGPKILVAGLTSVLEAWWDKTGDGGGVVSTWVVKPRVSLRPGWLRALTGIINSATLSRMYMAKHGGASMSGRQTTIKKRALRSLPVPQALAAFRGGEGVPEAFDPWHPERSDEERLGLLSGLVAGLHGSVHEDLSAPHDLLAHGLVAALYGRTREEGEADVRWWRTRSRALDRGFDWEGALRMVVHP